MAPEAYDVTTIKVVANKPFSIRGKSYKVGQPVDLKGLPASKVSQLLNLRFVRPEMKTIITTKK